MASALEERIRARLSTVAVTNALSVHVLVDGFAGPTTNPDSISAEGNNGQPQGTLKEFLRYRRLILLFQNQSDTSATTNANKKRPAVSMQAFLQTSAKQAVCVMGMCVCEYAERAEPDHVVRSYIQYVDTTGLFEPRHEQSRVTKAMVGAYVDFVRWDLQGSYVHLLALAQPNFLFPGSEHCPNKRILATGDLVQWWLRTLTQSLATSKADTDRVILHAYMPERYGASEQTVHEELFGELPTIAGLSLHYGFPWGLGDAVDAVVPFFEDDPKWRLYQQLYQRKPRRESAVYELIDQDDADSMDEENDNEDDENDNKEDVGNKDDQNDKEENEHGKKDKHNGPKRTVQEFVDALTTRAEFFKDPDGCFIIVEFVGNEQRRQQRLRERCTEAATKGKQMLFAMNFSDAANVVASSSKLLPWMRFMGSQGINIAPATTKREEEAENNSPIENAAKRIDLTNL